MELIVSGLVKKFDEKIAVENISFTAHSGKAFGLLGPNGSGKTTILRMIMQIVSKDSGSISIDGKEISHNDVNISYLPEVRALFIDEKISTQLYYLASLKGLNKKDSVKEVDTYLKEFGLLGRKKDKLKSLSKGNQQKIQIIQALLGNPKLIILDEPFSGLDPVNAQFLKEKINEMVRKDIIVLFTSHQMNYIEEFCDDIIIIKDGKEKIKGSITKIKENKTKNQYDIVTNEKIKNLNCATIIRENNSGYFVEINTTYNELLKEIIEKKIQCLEIKKHDISLFDIFVQEVGKENE